MLPMSKSATRCEYGRCGGLGHKEVKRKWRVRVIVRVDEREWRVCEGCANLLIEEARLRGLDVSREEMEPR